METPRSSSAAASVGPVNEVECLRDHYRLAETDLFCFQLCPLSSRGRCTITFDNAERMEATIGKTGFRDAAIGTGIAVDKMLALTGQMPSVNVAVVLPTPEERAQMDETDRQLDAIAARLRALPPAPAA